MSIINSSVLKASLIEELRTASSIVICSAFISTEGAEWIIETNSSSDVEIILRGRIADFLSNASSIEALRKFLNKGWRVKINENLHAKIFVFDRQKIFVGSSNLTGKGLVFSKGANIEANTQIEADPSSLAFINAISEGSIDLSSEKLSLMEGYLNSIETNVDKHCLVWPEELFEDPISKLFVEDFPSGGVGCNLSANNKFSSIDHLIKEGNIQEAQKLFALLRLTKWFMCQLEQYGDLRYGQLSKLLHSDLVEDPRVYRRDLKILQSNFLEYVEKLLLVVEVFQPSHTTFYKLKQN